MREFEPYDGDTAENPKRNSARPDPCRLRNAFPETEPLLSVREGGLCDPSPISKTEFDSLAGPYCNQYCTLTVASECGLEPGIR